MIVRIPRSASAFLWQDKRVFAAASRGDGRQLASGGEDPFVWVWDMRGVLSQEPAWIRPLMKLALPSEKPLHVHGIAWSPDQSRIMAWDGLHGVHLWDAASGAHVRSFGPKSGVFTASWSRDGSRILAASQNAVAIHDVESGKAVRTLRAPGAYVITALWSPDETRFLVASYNAPIGVHSMKRAKPMALAGSKGVFRATWSAGGSRVLYGASGEGGICSWDSATGQRLPFPAPEGALSERAAAQWSPDGTAVVLFRPMDLPRFVAYDAESGAVRAEGALAGPVAGVAWNRAGTHFIAYGAGAQVCALGSTTPVFELDDHMLMRTALWSPDETRIVTGGDERCVRVWEIPEEWRARPEP